jgi:hypothetical protein
MVAKMTPQRLAGTLLLILLFAALLPSFNVGINHITNNTQGLSQTLAKLVIPFILIAILTNLLEDDDQ